MRLSPRLHLSFGLHRSFIETRPKSASREPNKRSCSSVSQEGTLHGSYLRTFEGK